MTSTPPPPGRIHTPPTPLHGPKYDKYEPYSPRRSSRVAAQQSKGTPSPRHNSSPLSKMGPTEELAAPSISRVNVPKHSSFVTSSSNNSTKRATVNSPSASHYRARPSKYLRTSPLPASDSDTDILPEKDLHRPTSSRDSFGMLNTPAKTPRKRKDTALNGTARLLFGESNGVLAPTPRRVRKSRADPFSILQDDDSIASTSQIQIYTDSKDRVPSMDEDESNPFLTKNAEKPATRSKARHQSSKDDRAEEPPQNEKGMIYVFRGRKIFRKYEESKTCDDEDDNLSDMDIRRKAGPAAGKPFLRSSIKPRLLFPTNEQRREREEAHDADEETLTDLEMPKPNKPTTPTRKQGRAITPPSTTKAVKIDGNVSPDHAVQLHNELEDAILDIPKARKRGPFDAFQRKKATVSMPKGNKREASPIASNTSAKRARSGVSS